ncbi:unnamed protein product [Durusdinium trenchii]|uniref:Uncharacterized protein n=2 Tax=Durusdinium trenchii TaxID=1381693 RepID=A0ABP0NX35_9DINO
MMEASDGWAETAKLFTSGIYVQKYVTIQNVRLGLLHLCLKIAAGIWALVLMFSLRAYDNNAVPSGSFLEVWQMPAPSAQSGDFSYCTNPEQYDYVYNEDYVYKMSGCETLHLGEAHRKQGNSIFFPTSIDDSYVWTFGAAACAAGSNASEAQVLCNVKGGILRILDSTENGKSCQCLISHSFFARHPEGQRLFFTHGFEASNLGVMGNGRMRGSIRSDSNQYSYDGKKWQDLNDGGILTMVQDQNGESCALGGHSKFLPDAARQGIGGTLSEWMVCAGVDLQMADPKMRSQHPMEWSAPTARVTGLELNIQLDYRNVHHEVGFSGVVCYVRISAIQLWNSENYVSYGQLLDGGWSSYRSRHQRGVEVRFLVEGRIDFMDFIRLTTAISNVLTIMSIPAILVSLLALYGLGPLSSIYAAAANSKVNVCDDTKTAVTRLITNEAAMKLIEEGITRTHVRNTFTRALTHYIDLKPANKHNMHEEKWKRKLEKLDQAEGTLQDKELDQLVEFVMQSINHRKKGQRASQSNSRIDVEEYLKLHLRNDPVQLPVIVQLFDDDRDKGILERIFQDSHAFDLHQEAVRCSLILCSGQGDQGPLEDAQFFLRRWIWHWAVLT